ncbi:hypothetical protein BH10BAC2_BH10BAC2_14220 [soil metagenome]
MLSSYLLINIFLGLITNVMGFFHINNLMLYHFYTLFEQWFLSYYILIKIIKVKEIKVYWLVNSGFTLFWLFNVWALEPLHSFNSNTSVVSSLIILLLCLYYIFELSKSEDILYFQKLPSFWIISGFLFYSALSTLIFAVYKYYVLQNLVAEGIQIWSLMHFTIVIKYIMISAGLICYKKRSSSVQQALLS